MHPQFSRVEFSALMEEAEIGRSEKRADVALEADTFEEIIDWVTWNTDGDDRERILKTLTKMNASWTEWNDPRRS